MLARDEEVYSQDKGKSDCTARIREDYSFYNVGLTQRYLDASGDYRYLNICIAESTENMVHPGGFGTLRPLGS